MEMLTNRCEIKRLDEIELRLGCIAWAVFAFIRAERRNQLAILSSSLQLLPHYGSLV